MNNSKLNVTDEELQHLYEPIAVRDKHIEALEAENEELRVLVDSAKPIVELSTVGKGWRDDWLKNARNILKQ